MSRSIDGCFFFPSPKMVFWLQPPWRWPPPSFPHLTMRGRLESFNFTVSVSVVVSLGTINPTDTDKVVAPQGTSNPTVSVSVVVSSGTSNPTVSVSVIVSSGTSNHIDTLVAPQGTSSSGFV